MDGMLLTYLAAGGITVLGFLCWEPVTTRIRAVRDVKIVDAIEYVDPMACFLWVNWTESGERTMGPCYIEEIRRPSFLAIVFRGASSWISFRSLEDGSRMILTGAKVQKCIMRTFPHPENINETLYWLSRPESDYIDVLPWPGGDKVHDYLTVNLGITKTIFYGS